MTGIRAIAAMMVCIFHFNPFTEKIFGKLIHNFFGEFHVGVTIFFVLSGFLIFIRYFNDVGQFNYYKYFVNRFARIYPLYFILTTAYFIFIFFRGNTLINDLVFQYVLNVTLTKGFFEQYWYSGILPAWSLTVEETFYIIAPIILILINKKINNIFYVWIVIISIGLLLVKIFNGGLFFSFFGSYSFMFSYTFFGRITEFLIGILLAWLMLKDRTLYNFKTSFPVYTFLGVIFIIFWIFIISLYKTNVIGIEQPEAKFINTFCLPLLGIFPLFYGLINEQSFIRNILELPFFQLLGKSSYAFYLIHLYIGYINDNILFVLIFGITISILLFKYIEDPLNLLIRSLFYKKMKN